MHYFLGIDIGGTKSHALIADETGRAVGFGQGGPGNHEVVGYEGLEAMLQHVTHQALLVHPLGPPADQVGAVLTDMLETNRAYLPQFFD